MIISTKSQYALRAVFEIARSGSGRVMTISEIATAQQVPQRYLEAILNQLRKGDLLEAQRGRSGGYKLAKSASRITVGEIVRLIDGSIHAIEETKSADSQREDGDVFASTWLRVQAAVDEVLDSTTFEQLMRLESEERLKKSPSYVI